MSAMLVFSPAIMGCSVPLQACLLGWNPRHAPMQLVGPNIQDFLGITNLCTDA